MVLPVNIHGTRVVHATRRRLTARPKRGGATFGS
jgi:hypothetical protein